YCYRYIYAGYEFHRHLHTFPTRRSSDLYDRNNYYGRIDLQELSGLPWLNSHTVRLPLELFADEKLAAIIVAEKPKFEVIPNVQSDRKSTRLNSSHVKISYAVFCLKKKYV